MYYAIVLHGCVNICIPSLYNDFVMLVENIKHE